MVFPVLVLSVSVFCLNRKKNNLPLILCSVVIANPYIEGQHPAQDGNGRGDHGVPTDMDSHSLITDSESELDLNEDIASIASSLADRLT